MLAEKNAQMMQLKRETRFIL